MKQKLTPDGTVYRLMLCLPFVFLVVVMLLALATRDLTAPGTVTLTRNGLVVVNSSE